MIVLLNSLLLFGQTPANDPHWELVWQDNFNTLNTNIWKVQNNFDHWGVEHQVYIDDNVYIENGSLVLETKKQTYSCPLSSVNQSGCVRQYNTGSPYSYTSGWVETKSAYHNQYGYMEARIKVPHGYGFWPAFWTFTGNPSYQEIDIFEMVPGRNEDCNLAGAPNFIHNANHMSSNIHTQPPGADPLCAGKFEVNQISNYTNWHTYGIEWSPSKLIWYIDGYSARITPNPGITASTMMILNVALNPFVSPYNNPDFPNKMYIDYVKVYELDKDCNTNLNACNYNFSSHDNKVKKNITIGNGSCSNSLSSGDNVYLRASEGVSINGDFTVPVGSQLYIDVSPCN